MTGPSIGVGRITIPYTVSALNHVCRMYVSQPTFSGGVWNIDKRASVGGTADWSLAAIDFAEAISNCLATGVTVGLATLEEYSSTGWLLRSAAAVTLPNLSGNTNVAAQLTLTLRDANFSRPKIVLMEHNQIAPFKSTSATGGAGGEDAMIAEFTAAHTLTDAPWIYMRNQHEIELHAGAFISFTTTYNRKLRRARGLA